MMRPPVHGLVCYRPDLAEVPRAGLCRSRLTGMSARRGRTAEYPSNPLAESKRSVPTFPTESSVTVGNLMGGADSVDDDMLSILAGPKATNLLFGAHRPRRGREPTLPFGNRPETAEVLARGHVVGVRASGRGPRCSNCLRWARSACPYRVAQYAAPAPQYRERPMWPATIYPETRRLGPRSGSPASFVERGRWLADGICLFVYRNCQRAVVRRRAGAQPQRPCLRSL
jgi:hypothetical protein